MVVRVSAKYIKMRLEIGGANEANQFKNWDLTSNALCASSTTSKSGFRPLNAAKKPSILLSMTLTCKNDVGRRSSPTHYRMRFILQSVWKATM